MAGIKRTEADKAFSKCVRERAGWKCERCNQQHAQNSMGIHASHHHGRGKWGIRFNPMNAEALCYGCHSLEGGTQRRREAVMTDAENALLIERMDDVSLAKMYRKTKGVGAIAKHYRDELKRMTEVRALGISDRLEFEEFY